MSALAGRVLDGLAACGLPPDRHGAVASSPLFARSIDALAGGRATPGRAIPIATAA